MNTAQVCNKNTRSDDVNLGSPSQVILSSFGLLFMSGHTPEKLNSLTVDRQKLG